MVLGQLGGGNGAFLLKKIEIPLLMRLENSVLKVRKVMFGFYWKMG